MRRSSYFPLVVLAAVSLVGCAASSPEALPPPTLAGFIIVLEGLPHPDQEPQLFQAERKSTKPQTEVGGSWMYGTALAIEELGQRNLFEILSDSGSYRAFSGEKKCGDFHPDYSVAWWDGDDNQTLLICFGCGEVKLVGPGETTRFDLAPGVVAMLRSVLDPYRTNRPRANGEK